jgi:hypothetical protein
MTGTTPSGLATSKAAPTSPEYHAPLDEAEARDVRKGLHRCLREAGYSAEQIRQLTGHAARTVRRDLATPNAPADAGDRRSDPRRPRDDRGRPASSDRPWPDPDAPSRRLTTREIRALREDYGEGELATRPEVVRFLESLSPAEAC